jgi:hypothetical protein
MSLSRSFLGFAAAAAFLAASIPYAVIAAGPFDGTYSGTVALARSQGGGKRSQQRPCNEPADGPAATRRVINGNLTLHGAGGVAWTAKVGPDGMISGQATLNEAATVSASGKITGDTMVLDYGTPHCGFHFEGRKTQ